MSKLIHALALFIFTIGVIGYVVPVLISAADTFSVLLGVFVVCVVIVADFYWVKKVFTIQNKG